MKKRICGLISAVSFLLIWGIVGGIDNGQPLSNAWWIVPLLATMLTSLKIGGAFEEV